MLNCSDSYVLSGPEDDSKVPKESLGKIIFDCLRKRDPQDVVYVDAVSEKFLTCGRLLKDTVKATTVLKNLGLQKGDVISIINENSLNYCVPMLAALYMGVTVNLVNPHFAYGELKHTLEISKTKVVICCEVALENVCTVVRELEFVKQVVLTGASDTEIKLDNFEDLLATTSTEAHFEPEIFDCATQGAFIFLSSGTTGLPKGLLITHQNFRAMIVQMIHPKYGNFSPQDTALLVLPFFHILGLGVLTAAIVASMKIVILKKFQPHDFLRSIQEHKITKLMAVPPLLLFLAKSSLVDNYDVSSIKDILAAAAPLGAKLQNETSKRLGGVSIRQGYGMTEGSSFFTIHSFGDVKPGSVGILVPETTAKVWDCSLKKNLGCLEVGELCFKAPMIVKEYLGNAKAMQECIDDEGFFHTGDLGYYDHDGHFYIVGRIKEIIKYKGFQVSPAEIEALMLTHPGVKDCAVIGIPHERAGEVPLAYVVPQPGANITEQEIANFVAERISAEKHLHGGVVFIKEIPKGESGKISRRKLKEIFLKSLQES